MSSFLESQLSGVVKEKEKLERRISFLKKYCDWDFLKEVKTNICDHGYSFSITIQVNKFEDIKNIIEKFKPSEVIKNHLKSTMSEYENMSPFILTCGYFETSKMFSAVQKCIKVDYIVNEELTINIEIPIDLCSFLKFETKEDPYGKGSSKGISQTEISIDSKKILMGIDCQEFGTSFSYVSYHKYYAKTDYAAIEIKRLLGLDFLK